MRAASASTRRGLAAASILPLRWSTTRDWVRSGARHTGSAPPRSSDRRVKTASRTSEPSSEPQPERTTPTRLAMVTALADILASSKSDGLLCDVFGQPSFHDGLARAAHERKVVLEVGQGREPVVQDFLHAKQVRQIGAAVASTGLAGTAFFDGERG